MTSSYRFRNRSRASVLHFFTVKFSNELPSVLCWSLLCLISLTFLPCSFRLLRDRDACHCCQAVWNTSGLVAAAAVLMGHCYRALRRSRPRCRSLAFTSVSRNRQSWRHGKVRPPAQSTGADERWRRTSKASSPGAVEAGTVGLVKGRDWQTGVTARMIT